MGWAWGPPGGRVTTGVKAMMHHFVGGRAGSWGPSGKGSWQVAVTGLYSGTDALAVEILTLEIAAILATSLDSHIPSRLCPSRPEP